MTSAIRSKRPRRSSAQPDGDGRVVPCVRCFYGPTPPRGDTSGETTVTVTVTRCTRKNAETGVPVPIDNESKCGRFARLSRSEISRLGDFQTDTSPTTFILSQSQIYLCSWQANIRFVVKAHTLCILEIKLTCLRNMTYKKIRDLYNYRKI